MSLLLPFWLACTLSADSAADTSRPAELSPPAPGSGTGITYEIYVRSFQDSDGDGIGDLAGVASRLDHLDALGVETIWLMPIFPAFGPAGYDVTGFDTVTAEYGDADDLAALVDAAHARGMRVVLDLPLNHVHRDHPWFAAAESGDPEAHDWFRYAPTQTDERWYPGAQGDWFYAYFGEDMPDLDFENPPTRAAMEDVFMSWMDVGADGYRLDAVLMLAEEGEVVEGAPGSHTLVGELIALARETHPEAWFLAEASEWEVDKSVSWVGTEEEPGADAVLDFPRHDALLDAAETGTAAAIIDVVSEQVALGRAGQMVGFLGSHDLDRLPTTVPDAQTRRALRVAQYLLPGDPVLYYGEEIDLVDASTGTGQDWAMRAPMPWSAEAGAGFTDGAAWFPPDESAEAGLNVAAQEADPESMLSLVRALGCVREAYALGGDGAWLPLDAGDPGLLAFARETATGRLVVVVNLGDTPRAVTLPPQEALVDLGSGVPLAAGLQAIGAVEGHGWRVLGSIGTTCALPAR